MFQRAIYIYLSLFWLVVGFVLAFRAALFPGWEPSAELESRMKWLYVMAFLFAGWNALRYGMTRMNRRTRVVGPGARRDLSSPPIDPTA